MPEDDEKTYEHERRTRAVRVDDNSLGRLLTLADGVFAIAMTLLALDLLAPDFGSDHHPSDSKLRDALTSNWPTYLSFLLSFYIVAIYWMRHRQLMRSVVTIHAALIRDTLVLLLTVAAMPFVSNLLGRYGSLPSAVATYSAVNALALVALLTLSYDIRRLGLTASANEPEFVDDFSRRWQTWMTLAVFLICVPAAYLVGHHAAYLLLLLALPDRVVFLRRVIARRNSRD